MVEGRITGLYVYPIKSCAGMALEKAHCNELGLLHDREWCVVDSNGTVLTQRDKPSMALIQSDIKSDGILTLRASGMPSLTCGRDENTEKQVPVELWGDKCAGFDQGPDAAQWLSEFLETPCRLLRHDRRQLRKSRYGSSDGLDSRVAFADCCPLSVISEESLEDLNKWLAEPISMNRFRPSIVISGMGKYSEDRSKTLSAGETMLRSIKPCARCVIVTVCQDAGVVKGPEPLQTLSKYRRHGGKILFGQYFVADRFGLLQVGDPLQALPDR